MGRGDIRGSEGKEGERMGKQWGGEWKREGMRGEGRGGWRRGLRKEERGEGEDHSQWWGDMDQPQIHRHSRLTLTFLANTPKIPLW